MVRQTIADEVSDILGISREPGQGPAYKLVNLVLNTIVSALYRGEKVKIDGFGIFEVYERSAYRHSACFYPTFTAAHQRVVLFPAKKRVIFKPSKAILRTLNS